MNYMNPQTTFPSVRWSIARHALLSLATCVAVVGVATFGPSASAEAVPGFTPSVVATISVGDGPSWISSGPQGVYVTNSDSDSVSVINPATNTVVDTLSDSGLSSPTQSLVVGDELFVASSATNKVFVFNTITYALAYQISVGTNPVALEQCGDEIFVANHDSGSLSVIDRSTHALSTGFTNPIVLNHNNTSLLAADGDILYAVNAETEGTLDVIDCATHSIHSTHYVGDTPAAIAVGTDWVGVGDSGRSNAWFYNKEFDVTNTQMNLLGLSGNPSVMAVANEKAYMGGGTVAAVAMAQMSPSQVILANIGGSNPVILPSGSQVNAMTVFDSYLFVAGLNNSPVNVIDTTNDTVIASLEAGDGSFGFGSSGRYVYLSNSISGTVTVIAAREADPSVPVPPVAPAELSNTGIDPAQTGLGITVGSIMLAFGILIHGSRRRTPKQK